ncbi:DUF2852 domain-containing protein [Bosea sp. PAMC 26642]|uniref:DUF2852 domain-containing protein n=1 Tax=Bosea sp. (strain PAMC 26642) TaxID=1792307 RepID=UPI0007705C49|nr:DUF2852 domain-containing protein [Bosea sp. PAMC 26642]AMJ61227.1 hypothetical protein AXW83_13790 [Bosea sp. PAMC 26642]
MPIVAKLDEFGKGAWIAFAVLGFFLFWPLGLATLAFIIWSGRMGCGHAGAGRYEYKMSRLQEKMERLRQRMGGQEGGLGGGFGGGGWHRGPSSGNRAFDEYRQETLRRLEDEQREFQDFLGKLRMARDKAEFDQFMADRRSGEGTVQTAA